jgi:hypothetical protein
MLEDCCASYIPEFHEVAVRMVSAQGGVFGSVTDSETFVQTLKTGIDEKHVANGCAENQFEVIEAQNPTIPMTTPQSLSNLFIDAKPYKWPYNGNMTPQNTCIIVIDMQVDFCAK